MVASAAWFAEAFATAFNKEWDLLSDAIKLELTTSTWAVDTDTMNYQNDITNEVASAIYTAGGELLANDTFTYTAGTNTWKYTSDPVPWTNVTFTTRYGAIYDSTPGVAASNPLILFEDWGGDQTVNAANFTVTPAAAGWATITV